MTTARFVIALGLLLFAALVALMNWWCVIASTRNKRRGVDRYHSTVPLVSLVLTGVACLAYPRPDKMWMFLVPLLDMGNWKLLQLPLLFFRRPGTDETKGKRA